jgi:hypothetical protein
MKIWKTIKGFEDYQVSSDGEIKTFNWKNKGIEAIMKPAFDNSGYLRTMLKHKETGKFCTIKVHRIVAQNFIDNPLNKPQVNHMNGIRHDNRVDNLEWVTMSENQLHSYRVLNRDVRGEKNSCAKLKNENVLWIRENYPNRKNLNLTRKKIAEMFGISEGTLKQVISRKKWKHI